MARASLLDAIGMHASRAGRALVLLSGRTGRPVVQWCGRAEAFWWSALLTPERRR